MMRETTVAPLGLVTKPNEVGQYPPGALHTALNVCMRAPGVLQPLPAREAYAANGGGASNVEKIWPGDSRLLVFASGTGLFWVDAAARDTITRPTGWPLDKSAACFMRARGRFFVGSAAGPLAIDGESDTAARYAGLTRPVSIDVQSITTASTDQALATGRNANYRAIVTRRMSDGYLLVTPPTNAMNVWNDNAAAIAPTIRIQWLQQQAYEVGDVVELYRTVSQAAGTDPGAVYRLCATKTLDSADVAGEQVDIKDNCADANLGTELYTNPGQPTQSRRANRAPGLARDMATYKGYAFFVSPYAHARATLKVLGATSGTGAYLTGNDITHGLGVRLGTGTFASGSPTITGVSAGTYTGLAVGQEIVSIGGFTAAGTTVLSFNQGASTITMSANATGSSGATGLYTMDRISINNEVVTFSSLAELASNIVANGNIELLPTYSEYIRKKITSTGSIQNIATTNQVTIIFETPFYGQTGNGTLTVRATNHQNYSPTLTALSGSGQAFPAQERKNRITYSKLDQPEHVPEENEIVVGQGAIHRLIATKDCIFCFCSDGLYRITGDGGAFRVDIVDPSLRLATRSSVDVMLDDVWAYTNRGLVVIGPDGVRQEISQARIGDLIPGGQITSDTTDASTTQFTTFLTCDPHNREVRLCIRSGGTSTLYIYNALTDRFTTASDTGNETEVVAEVYAPYLSSIVWSGRANDASCPLYRYATDGSTRDDSSVRFQPLYGGKDPFSLKQWDDFELLFRNVGGGSSLTLDTKINGTDAYSGVTSTNQNGLYRFVTAVPIEHAMAPSASFGFAPLAQGDAGWQLVGLSSRFVLLSNQVQK